MQRDLDAQGYDVAIHGINGIGHESGNDDVCAGRDLPWLQDEAAVDAWSLWRIEYRDVVVVDAEGLPVGVYNLTVNDLAVPENRDALWELLVDAP